MRYPNPAMLLYIGIGDAYASAVEYVKLPEWQGLVDEVLKFERYHKHPTFGLCAGMYTDDTEMSVANTSVLLDYKPPYMPLMFAKAWVREFARGKQRKGYSKTFQEFLEYIESGEEFLLNINPNSNKNGAAMRSVPFGVLRSISEVIDVATIQAMITHGTPEGLFSARAVALMSHFALYESAWLGKGLREYCLDNLPKQDIERFGYVFRQAWDDGDPRTGARYLLNVGARLMDKFKV